MKKIPLLLLAFFLFVQTHAQRHEIDSLKQALQKEKTDTGRVNLLNNLAFIIHESQPDTAMTLALQALELSRKIRFESGEAKGLRRIGNVYSVLGNYPKALDFTIHSLKICEKIEDLNGIASNLHNIGLVHFRQGNYRLALQYYFETIELEEQIMEPVEMRSITIINIAEAYSKLKMYDSATLYAQQSYNMASKVNYSRIIGSSLRLLGEIHFQTDKNILALEYCRLSFPYLKLAENYFGLSNAYSITATIFDKLNNADSAKYYGLQSLAVAKAGGFNLEVRNAARFLSRFYRKFNADSAFFYQDIAAAMNDSLFSQDKQRDIQSLAFDEQIRQNEIATEELKAKEERKYNLQYAGIAIAIITFLIIFFAVSRSVIVNEKFIKFFGIFGLLAVFEFINLYIHPILDKITSHTPILMLAILMAIAALLIPLHHKLEKWITKIMVEKNKKIRLEAAKKTIKELEGEQNN